MKKLIIFGNAEMARVVYFYFTRDSEYEVTGFCVHSAYKSENEYCGLNVFDFETILSTHPPEEYEMFIAIGPSKMNGIRENIYNQAKELGYRLASYISPNAVCNSSVGDNSFVADMAVINPYVQIGSNNYIWEQVYLGSDSCVGSHCYISPKSSVGTFVRIEDNVFVGTSSTIKTCVKVCKHSLIGAQCYIAKDTSEFSVYGTKEAPFLGNISHKIDVSRKNILQDS